MVQRGETQQGRENEQGEIEVGSNGSEDDPSPHHYDGHSRPAVFIGLLEHQLAILFSTHLQFALPRSVPSVPEVPLPGRQHQAGC